MGLKNYIEQQINNTLNVKEVYTWQHIGGGSINETYKVTSKNQSFFVKINTIAVFENGFKEEVLGLQFLSENSALVPEIILEGIMDNQAYLVLEWIASGHETSKFWKRFAKQLATLHQQKNDVFGLSHSNFMGELPQKNTFKDNFSDFFIENRLIPQVELAFNNRLIHQNHINCFEALYKKLPEIFPLEKPCAVHGDLWSGNFMCSRTEKAVLIDPAVYYGHREVDLAMSKLFGGFSNEFYEAYQDHYPLENGFTSRKDIYNLYPLLIHLNLFGSSYLGSVERIISPF